MGSIYQDSTLTIFAMTSKRSEEGFLKTANPPNPTPLTLKVSLAADNQTSIQVTGREFEEENIGTLRSNSALSKRGWAFQEVMLSRRRLFFGARQIYWQCRQEFDSLEGLYSFPSSCGEEIEVIVPQTDGQPGRSGRARLDFYTLASKYNSKALTYSSDKLPAFSGLAQKFQHVFGGEYLSGLWSNHIHRGLLWFPIAPLSSDSAAQPNHLPSWSWASTNEWVFFVMAQPEDLLELHCYDVRLHNRQNRYGEIKSEGDATRPSITVIGMTMPLARGNRISNPHDQRLDILGGVNFDVLRRMEGYVYDHKWPGIPLTIVDDSFMLSLLYPRKEGEEGEGEGEEEHARDPYPGLQRSYLALAVSGELSDEWSNIHGLILQESGNAFKRVGVWEAGSKNWSWKGWKKDQMLQLV